MKAPHGWRGPKVRDPSSQAKTKIVIFVFFLRGHNCFGATSEWNGMGKKDSQHPIHCVQFIPIQVCWQMHLHPFKHRLTILNLPDSLHSFFLFLLVKLRFCETLLGSRTNNKHDMFSTCNTHTALRACL